MANSPLCKGLKKNMKEPSSKTLGKYKPILKLINKVIFLIAVTDFQLACT